MLNPYTLVFGQPPIEIIERGPQIEKIVGDFCRKKPANYINLITGIRGSGKTVFLTEVANRIKQKDDWVVINLNPERDLLSSFAAKLNSYAHLSKIFRDAEINLEFFGFGLSVITAPPITDIEEALSRMLLALKKHNKRVLVTIDEVSNTNNIRAFASSFQIFLREDLPVFLLMTGLFKNVNNLKNAKGMTFLERAPRTVLGPLDQGLIAAKYKETLELPDHKAVQLAKKTCGYSFTFQTLGYFFFEYQESGEKAETAAKEYLYEFAYEKIWSELSKRDRETLKGIAETPSTRVQDIRETLGITPSQLTPYRDRLIKAGILFSDEYGQIEWALPFFNAFCLQKFSVSLP